MRKRLFSSSLAIGTFLVLAVFTVFRLPSATWAEDTVVHFGGSYGVAYTPREITVNSGDTVTWQGDFSAHPLASDESLWTNQSSGGFFSHRFDNPGSTPVTYHYYSTLQGGVGGTGMSGTVTVLPVSPSPSPTASPTMIPFSDVSDGSAYASAIASLRADGILEGYADGTFRPGTRINRAEFMKIVMANFRPYAMNANGNSNTNGTASTNANANGASGNHNGNANESVSVNANGNANLNANANMNGNVNGNSNANGTNSNLNGPTPTPTVPTSPMPPVTPFPGNCFPDVGSEWYAQWICQAKAAGIVRGYPDGMFHPERNIDFVEAAKIIVLAMIVPEADEETGDRWFRGYVLALEGAAAIPTSISTFGQTITRGEMAEMAYRVRNGIKDRESKTYLQLEAASQ